MVRKVVHVLVWASAARCTRVEWVRQSGRARQLMCGSVRARVGRRDVQG